MNLHMFVDVVTGLALALTALHASRLAKERDELKRQLEQRAQATIDELQEAWEKRIEARRLLRGPGLAKCGEKR